MSLAARILEERSRLAAAKERLRSRKQGQFGTTNVDDVQSQSRKPFTQSSKSPSQTHLSTNRRWDFRSPKSTGVSVKVMTSSSPSSHSIINEKRLDLQKRRRRTSSASTASGGDRDTVSLEDIEHEEEELERLSVDPKYIARLKRMTARESALRAKLISTEQKLDFAEAELTAKANICDQYQEAISALREKVEAMEVQVTRTTKEKLDAISERDISRNRVYTLSERVAYLEKSLEQAQIQVKESSQLAMDSKRMSSEKVDQVERELAQARAVTRDTKDQLDCTTRELENVLKRNQDREGLVDTLSVKCAELEQFLNEEREAKITLGLELAAMKKQLKAFERGSKDSETQTQEIRMRNSELEKKLSEVKLRHKEMEQAFQEELSLTRSKLSEARVETEKALERAKEASTKARALEESRLKADNRLEQENKRLREQLARRTLHSNAEEDARAKHVALLEEQLEMYKKKIELLSDHHVQQSDKKSSPRGKVEGKENGKEDEVIEQTPSRAMMQGGVFEESSVEELVVDVDLPNGSSVELVVRAGEDPTRVVSAFSTKHALTPRVSKHLEQYVVNQLRSGLWDVSATNVASSSTSSSARPNSPPPPPPPLPVESKDESSFSFFQKDIKVAQVKDNNSTASSSSLTPLLSDAKDAKEIHSGESRLRRLSRLNHRQ